MYMYMMACKDVANTRGQQGVGFVLHHSEILHGLGVCIPVGQGTERTALVCAEKSETVYVTCVDPSETASVSVFIDLCLNDNRRYLPFTRNALEVTALVTVFGLDLVWVHLPRHVVFLNHDAVEVDKGFGNHEQPAVGQALCLSIVAIPLHADPGKHLLGSPSKGIVPLPVRAVETNLTT